MNRESVPELRDICGSLLTVPSDLKARYLVSVLDSYYCSSLRQRSHVLEGVEARNEEIGGELDDLGEQDGDLISALEKQVEKTRRGRLRVQKSEDRKRKVEQRLMAAYQRMESSSKGRGTVKPIR
ncbi:hypothetical protein FOZ62_001444, partial [Perkinsus olseni]